MGTAFVTPILVDHRVAAGARVFSSETDGVVDEVIAGLEQNDNFLGRVLVDGAHSVPRTFQRPQGLGLGAGIGIVAVRGDVQRGLNACRKQYQQHSGGEHP